MSSDKPVRAIPAQISPEERAARKSALAEKKFNRDRARMLAHVKTCVTSAEGAIAAGDVATHDKWLDATQTAIASYRQFVALSVAQTPAQVAGTPVTAG